MHTYEVGEVNGSYFIAMEYLDGQPLDTVLRAPDASKTFTPRMWAAIASEALAGLQYAHELCDYDGTSLEIVHRDVSPHNVFLTYDGEVKLVDFGIAKATLNTTRTETGILKGKVTYMAPEQAGGNVDRRSDVFSLGICLWEALTGTRLFVGDAMRVLNKLLFEEIPRPSSVMPSLDPRLDAIVARALEKEPAARFQSAEEMKDALDAYVRATGDGIRKADIGKAVSTLFRSVHESVREQIHVHMANLGNLSESNVRALSDSQPSSLPELRMLGSVSGRFTSQPPTASRVIESVSLRRAPPQRRFLGPVVGVMLVGAVIMGAVAVRARLRERTASLAASAAPARATTVLSLTSDPPEALIDWNGQPIGRTPIRVDLPPGTQTLILTKEGYYTETLRIDLPAGAVNAVERLATLRAKPAASASTQPAAIHVPKPKPGRPSGSAAPGSNGATTAPANAGPASTSTSTLGPIAPKDSW